MNDEQYLQHCHAQFSNFAQRLRQRCNDLPESDSLRVLANNFCDAAQNTSGMYDRGPDLVDRLFTTYPDFAPDFPRDLLWFLGGECLHYMPDDEIATYQQLDEMRGEAAALGKVLDLHQARAELSKLQ
jgi:hypothetical protein